MDAMADVVVLGDGCVVGPEVCNGVDDDCDGAVDEPEDLPADPMNCGACGIVCAGETPLCQRDGGGVLSCVAMCSGGLTECGGSCVDTETEPAHCGGCGSACALANATVDCVAAECVVGSCMAPYEDCDGADANGCEANLTVDGNCGGCGVTCGLTNATANCEGSGVCVIASCDPGFDDCDGDDETGCETTLGTARDCASCGDSCATGVCADGACGACPGGCKCTDTSCGTGGGGRCTCSSGCPCTFGCTSDCDVECTGSGAACSLDAVDANSAVDADCNSGATCRFDVRGQSNVTGICANAGTSCSYDCGPGPSEDTSNCLAIRCESGARCTIRCGSTINCDFEFCHRDETTCTDASGDRWITCGLGGACP